jgi:hypothetical protein
MKKTKITGNEKTKIGEEPFASFAELQALVSQIAAGQQPSGR